MERVRKVINRIGYCMLGGFMVGGLSAAGNGDTRCFSVWFVCAMLSMAVGTLTEQEDDTVFGLPREKAEEYGT